MPALWAEFSEPEESTDRRVSARRTLRLVTRAAYARITDEVLILDLSTTGLMLETAAALSAGETIEVELPGAGTIAAQVIWQRGAYFGCEFLTRAPIGAISAALLRSAPKSQESSALAPMFGGDSTLGDSPPRPKQGPASESLAMIVLLLLLVAVGTFMLAMLTLPQSIH